MTHHQFRFKMVHFNLENTKFRVNLKYVTYAQPIPLSWILVLTIIHALHQKFVCV